MRRRSAMRSGAKWDTKETRDSHPLSDMEALQGKALGKLEDEVREVEDLEQDEGGGGCQQPRGRSGSRAEDSPCRASCTARCSGSCRS